MIMRWECSECGCRTERPRPPTVCHFCGTAGVIFCRVEHGLEDDADAENLYDAWLHVGMGEDWDNRKSA